MFFFHVKYNNQLIKFKKRSIVHEICSPYVKGSFYIGWAYDGIQCMAQMHLLWSNLFFGSAHGCAKVKPMRLVKTLGLQENCRCLWK